MGTWRAVLYVVAVILLAVGGLILLAGNPPRQPVASALAYFAGACALLAFSLSALAATG